VSSVRKRKRWRGERHDEGNARSTLRTRNALDNRRGTSGWGCGAGTTRSNTPANALQLVHRNFLDPERDVVTASATRAEGTHRAPKGMLAIRRRVKRTTAIRTPQAVFAKGLRASRVRIAGFLD
jgi:hypothetical protein